MTIGRFELDKRDGKLLGVCAGLANFTGTNALWWRLGAVAGTLVGFGSLLIAYVLVGWLAQPAASRIDA